MLRAVRRLLFLACLAVLPVALRADAAAFSTQRDAAFAPLNDEGYMQAWNVNFRGNGLRLYLTFIISNLGPGRLNNGVSVLLFRDGMSSGATAEFAERSLQAQPGRFGHSSGPNHLLASTVGYQVEATAGNITVKLDLDQIEPGVIITAGDAPVTDDRNDFMRSSVPVRAARARGRLQIGEETVVLDGVAGMEYLYTNRSPHVYARRLTLIRSYERERGIFLGQLESTFSTPPSGSVGRYVLLGADGRLQAHYILRRETLGETEDSFSGFQIPTRVIYHDDRGCVLTANRLANEGKMNVLSSVSLFLRWVLRVLFAKPFILHYRASLDVQCADGTDTNAHFENLQMTYYLIND